MFNELNYMECASLFILSNYTLLAHLSSVCDDQSIWINCSGVLLPPSSLSRAHALMKTFSRKKLWRRKFKDGFVGGGSEREKAKEAARTAARRGGVCARVGNGWIRFPCNIFKLDCLNLIQLTFPHRMKTMLGSCWTTARGFWLRCNEREWVQHAHEENFQKTISQAINLFVQILYLFFLLVLEGSVDETR